MRPDPILEELWKIKDDLAREAGYDLHTQCENLRRWIAEHPPTGPVIHNAEELRQYVAEQERKRAQAPAWVLKDAPVEEE